MWVKQLLFALKFDLDFFVLGRTTRNKGRVSSTTFVSRMHSKNIFCSTKMKRICKDAKTVWEGKTPNKPSDSLICESLELMSILQVMFKTSFSKDFS